MKLTVISIVTLCAVLLSKNGQAQTVQRDFDVAPGIVYATAASNDGSMLFIGGSFGTVGPPVPHAALMNFESERPSLDFPRPNGIVHAVEEDGAGGWFIAGEFTRVDTMLRSRIAHVDASGALTAWAPQVGGVVNCMERAGDTLFIGGFFTSVDGVAAQRLAAFRVSTGELLTHTPAANNYVSSLSAMDGSLYMTGNFDSVDGQARPYIAACEIASGDLLPWSPDLDGNIPAQVLATPAGVFACGISLTGVEERKGVAAFDPVTAALLPWNANVSYGTSNVNVTAMTTHDGALYFTGLFNSVDGTPRMSTAAVDLQTASLRPFEPTNLNGLLAESIGVAGDVVLVGGFGESPVMAWDAATGALMDWRPLGTSGNRVSAIAGTADAFLVGGDFTTLGGEDRDGLAALDGATGVLLSDFPIPSGNAQIRSLQVVGDTLLVGGNFTQMGGAAHQGIAAIHIPTRTVLPWGVPFNNQIHDIAVDNGVVYVVGTFTTVGGQPRGFGAALSLSTGDLLPWDPGSSHAISSVVAKDGLVYVGGSFSTIGGEARQRFAALDGATALATPLDIPAQSAVWVMEVSGNTLYLGGNFTALSGQPRAKLGAIDLVSGQVTGWAPEATGGNFPEVWDLAVRNGLVHIGGAFTSVAGQPRAGYAVVDAVTGEATSAVVRLAGGAGAYCRSITPMPNLVLVGGGFNNVELEVRNSLFALADCELAAYYADADEDGYGDPANAVVECTPGPTGFVTNADDCNDGDDQVWTGGPCVTIAGDSGTWTTDCICIGTTGIHAASTAEELLVFPNPFTNELTLRTNLHGSLLITLTDMTGRVVIHEQRSHTADTDMVLTMDALAPGSYLLRIGSEAGGTVRPVMRE